MLKKKPTKYCTCFKRVFFLFPLVWKHCSSTDMFIYILTQPLPLIKMISAKQISGEKNHLNISVIRSTCNIQKERKNMKKPGLLWEIFFVVFQWTFEKFVKWEMGRTVKTLTAGQRKPGNTTRPSALSFCMETTSNSKLCLLLVSPHHNHKVYEN